VDDGKHFESVSLGAVVHGIINLKSKIKKIEREVRMLPLAFRPKAAPENFQ